MVIVYRTGPPWLCSVTICLGCGSFRILGASQDLYIQNVSLQDILYSKTMHLTTTSDCGNPPYLISLNFLGWSPGCFASCSAPRLGYVHCPSAAEALHLGRRELCKALQELNCCAILFPFSVCYIEVGFKLTITLVDMILYHFLSS